MAGWLVRFAKSDDFQLRNASDDVKETIRIGSRKIYDFDRKMLRIRKNRGKSMHFFANRHLERVRTCSEIVIFSEKGSYFDHTGWLAGWLAG